MRGFLTWKKICWFKSCIFFKIHFESNLPFQKISVLALKSERSWLEFFETKSDNPLNLKIFNLLAIFVSTSAPFVCIQDTWYNNFIHLQINFRLIGCLLTRLASHYRKQKMMFLSKLNVLIEKWEYTNGSLSRDFFPFNFFFSCLHVLPFEPWIRDD